MRLDFCKKCAYYQIFYSRGPLLFWVEEHGFCDYHERCVSEKHSCKFWRVSENKTIQMLDNAIEEINILKQIFDAE